ncbi:MAG: YfcC family protein [Hyphomonadaceae bacterium]
MTIEAEASEAPKRRFEFPSAFSILFALIAIAAIATWFVPAGQYTRVENEALGRELAVRGSYHTVEANPQTVFDAILAPVEGFYDAETETTRAVDVVLFVLFIGGFMGVVARTGAIDAGIVAAMRALTGRELWMIPILTGLFTIGGTTIGMAEEALPFIALLVPVMMRAGYDSVVAVAVALIGTTIGTLASTTNPFATVIASNAAGISFMDGIELRLLMLAAVFAVSVAFLMRYAMRIKAAPEHSIVADRRAEIEAHYPTHAPDSAKLTLRQWLVLALFIATFALMIWGVASQGWWMAQMTALFLAASIVVALAGAIGERDLVESFMEGARSLLGVALIIGVARGVLVVMEDGRITDTILHAGEVTLAGFSSVVFVNALLGIELVMSFLVPSSSGHAVLTMPVLAPLGDFANVDRSLIVTVYQVANGVVSLFTPTSAVMMGSIAIGRVPFERWLAFVLPLALILLIICGLMLSIAVSVG